MTVTWLVRMQAEMVGLLEAQHAADVLKYDQMLGMAPLSVR